jgi:hypothetical protein
MKLLPNVRRSLCTRYFTCLQALVLLLILHTASAQLTTQGEPAAGNSSGGGLTTSPMYLDATQFPSTDMCASIAKACGSTSPIPGGTTIDARGFTGNQVCKATTVTIMLNKCTANGGRLLLGLVNLYADGPASGNYADGNGSGVGTPAFILPSKFWGIEGVSRGAGDSGSTLGTFLSAGWPSLSASNEDEGGPLFPRSVRKGWETRLSAPKVHASLIGC